MITFNDNAFHLQTDASSYILRITKHGHLEHIYYGTKLEQLFANDIEALAPKRTTAAGGTTVAYDRDDQLYRQRPSH